MKFCAILALTLFGWVSAEWKADPPFYAQRYHLVGGARGLYVDETGDLLVLARSASSVIAVYEEENSDGSINVVQTDIVRGGGLNLNHGLTYSNGYLYASSTTTVFRWPYTPGQRTQINVDAETVVRGMPTGGHNTRSLAVDTDGALYVSCGSDANVDRDSSRARIRRFSLNSTFPMEWNSGEVFADGLRNEVGITFDKNGVLWGVENGADQLRRDDLGGDIHNGNPAEEMNRFNHPAGTHYGYPYCFSTHNLDSYEPGTQFAWPDFMTDGTHTDAWCKNTANNQPPVVAMPAHNAPLGIDFHKGQNCDGGEGAFPCEATGGIAVAFHGSWNSDIPVGYRVGWFEVDPQTSEPAKEEINIVYETDTVNCGNCFRPVHAVFNNKGHLLISDDANGQILRVTYGTPPRQIKAFKTL